MYKTLSFPAGFGVTLALISISASLSASFVRGRRLLLLLGTLLQLLHTSAGQISTAVGPINDRMTGSKINPFRRPTTHTETKGKKKSPSRPMYGGRRRRRTQKRVRKSRHHKKRGSLHHKKRSARRHRGSRRDSLR